MDSCPDFDVGNTLGALLIGAIISYTLLGISTIQVYIYYKRFPQDSMRVKCMVGGVWLGEIGQSISFAISLYTMLITNFGHPERLVRFPTSLIVSAFLASLVAFTVQSFFAYRIYTLSRSLYIPALCWVLSLFRLIPANVILFGWGLRDPAPEILSRWGPLFNAIWAVSAVNDILIAGTMVVLLKERRANVLERNLCRRRQINRLDHRNRGGYQHMQYYNARRVPNVTNDVCLARDIRVNPAIVLQLVVAIQGGLPSSSGGLSNHLHLSQQHNATMPSRHQPVQIAVEMTKVMSDPYDD
ncbi:hypothetical protein R3P38DRAFT_3574745 [Favolaschia claudopus]|uniref:Uncharacterized protein n=1 Tax=Favolaschia claudopus TaxID=2862362 RepID=A0AAW0APT9_9AGAR